jgi:UDP-N-acetylmuramoyl-tripeptide--D-alanyl-D-alanine ligase
MRPALYSLKKIPAKHKVAILGDMLELGVESEAEHLAMLRFAARTKPDVLVLVGPEFGKTPYAKYKALHFPDAAKAREWFEKQAFEETLILVKGSRGIKVGGGGSGGRRAVVPRGGRRPGEGQAVLR